MKIVLDIDKLLQEGRITIAECSRLKGLPGQESRSLAFNTLIAFGVIATAAGALALLPSGVTAIALGLALSAAGFFLFSNYAKE